MLKIKRNKKLMIPVLAMILIVAMAGSAFAATTSYSMVVPAYSAMTEYDTHIYGSSSYDTYTSNCTGYGTHAWFRSKAYCATTNTYASGYMDVDLSGTYAITTFYASYRSSSYMIRFKMFNDYYNSTNTVSGRYGLQ